MAEAPSSRRRPPSRRPASVLRRLGRRLDRGLKALEGWTRRLNTLTGFLVAVAALAIAAGALGLRSCGSPGPSPTPSAGETAAASGSTSSTSAVPTATPEPTPTPVPPANYRLRWVESPTGGNVLDNSILTVGRTVWMEELYPKVAPTGFDVEAILDPALGAAMGGVITGPGFEVKAKDFVAHSDRAWTLPAPPPSSGSISYRFRDNDGRLSGAVTVATFATIELRLEPGGADKLPSMKMNIDEDLRIEADVAFTQPADVGVVLLTPWESGETGLRDFVRAYYGEVTRNPGEAEAATRRFLAQYAGALPQGRPDGWQFGVEPGAFSGKPGAGTSFALTGNLPTADTTLLAVKLVDQSDPSRVAVSDIFRVEVVGPDTAPSISILEPDGFAQGTTLELNGIGGQLFAEIQLQADVSDADGPLPDDAIVWTTDRGDLQPEGAELGRGEFLITKLYADSCKGAIHVVTLTVDDGTGHVVQVRGNIVLRCSS